MAQFDAIFEGGGAKGLAHSGGLLALEQRGHTIRRLIGTSAGAINAVNVAAGYTAQEIIDGSTAKTPDGKSIYSTFMDPPTGFTDAEISRSCMAQMFQGGLMGRLDDAVLRLALHARLAREVFSFVELGGLYAGDAFLSWMQGCLSAKGLGGATFGSMFAKTGRDVSVVVTDLSRQRMLVLNHRTAPDCPVAWGVRMSMSIPLVWQEIRWDAAWGRYRGEEMAGQTIVDGGVVSNFPLHLFADIQDPDVRDAMGPVAEPLPCVGFYLDGALPVPDSGSAAPKGESGHGRLLTRTELLINTMMNATDNREIDVHGAAVCRLPVQGYGTTEFDMSDARTQAIIKAGRQATLAWLDARGA